MSQTLSLPTGTIAWASGGPAPKVPADLRVGELLERAAEADVSIVFVQGGKECRIPCRELARCARQRAAALLDAGIGPESRVGLLEAASRDFVECFFGVLLTGAAVVVPPLLLPFGRTASVAAQLARIVDRAGLAAAIVSPHLTELAAAAGRGRVWTASELQAPDPLRIERPALDAPAIIQFTSGKHELAARRGAEPRRGARRGRRRLRTVADRPERRLLLVAAALSRSRADRRRARSAVRAPPVSC